MTDEEIMRYIDYAVERALSGIKKRTSKDVNYNEVSYLLDAYYHNGETVPKLKAVINDISDDKYFEIIPRYYKDGQKIDAIAESMGIDISTVVRNKKRLCMDIYVALMA